MSADLWSGRWAGSQPAGEHHRRAREVITRSGGIMRGKFPSRKNGRMVHCEGLLEFDAAFLFEASPCIRGFREQPTTITYPDGDRTRRYTPDFEVTLASGASLWVEIKPTRSLEDEATRHKLDRVAEHMERSGVGFALLTDAVIRCEPRLSNLKTIVHRAPTVRSSATFMRTALAKCAEELPASARSATPMLAAHGLEPYSLLLGGLLRCALDLPLSPDTELTLATEADDGWFHVSPPHGF